MDEKDEENKAGKKNLSKKRKKKKSSSKAESKTGINNVKVKGIIITVAAILAVYVILSCYFCNHFFIGTKINDMSVSGMTVSKANEEINNKIDNYKLKIEERDNIDEEIDHDTLNLSYTGAESVQNIKDSQTGFAWITNLFSNKKHYVENLITYSDENLTKAINKLSCFKKENIKEPKNASFEYVDGKYNVIDEVNGAKVDKVLLKDTLVRSIEGLKDTVNLENENCYIVPKYKAGDDKVNSAKDELDKYVTSKINYSAGDKSLTLDGSVIHEWLSVNDEMDVTFDEKKVSSFLKTLGENFNTVGISRKFKTTGGSTVTVSGGDYGWKIDKDKEKEKIIETVKNGNTEDREPIYSQKAYSHDGNEIGNSYVEVSLGGQHLWVYKNGQLVTDGAVVTGNTSAGHGTPSGVYFVVDKERNTTLIGPGYASDVSFWMPFNGGIGMHDASWRSSFGGSIYRYNGSHGCVNCSYSLAQSIYRNIDTGIPVICY